VADITEHQRVEEVIHKRNDELENRVEELLIEHSEKNEQF